MVEEIRGGSELLPVFLSESESDVDVVDLEERERLVKFEVAVKGGLRKRNLFKKVEAVVVAVTFLRVLDTTVDDIFFQGILDWLFSA